GDDTARDDVEDVVEVDGGRAVAGDHLRAVAEIERRRTRKVSEAVLLGVIPDLGFGIRGERWRHEVDPDGLATAVEDDRVALPADHGAENRHRDLEAPGDEVAVEAIHQRVRARLHLGYARVRSGDVPGTGAARRDNFGW